MSDFFTPSSLPLVVLAGLVLSLMLVLAAQAQSLSGATISGQVRDASGKPVEFATVLLVRAADSSMVKGAVTDAGGKYQFEIRKDGTFRVVASQVGYQKVVSPPFTTTIDQLTFEAPQLVLLEAARTLGTVTVTARKPFIEQLPDKTVINVENSIISAGGTALEVLEKAPGVLVDAQNERITLKGRTGTLVMIDGKPTYLSAQEVVNLLRNTPSNSIQSIELISNPSAKYDAAGNAGIINIRLKRGSRTDGTNGSATLGAGYGRFPKTSAGLTFNHRKAGWSLFGNYNHDYREQYGTIDAQRQFGVGDSLSTVRNLGYRPSTSRNHAFKIGADYALGRRTTFGLMLNGQFNDSQAEIDNQNLVYDARNRLQRTVTMINASTRTQRRFSANANFKHLFDTLGRELTLDADFSRVAISPQDAMTTRYFDALGTENRPALLQRNRPPSTVLIRAGKADYVHPLGKKTRVEIGGKISYVTSDNDVRFETLTEGTYVPDPTRTNHFLYDETISAGYFNASHTRGKWSMQGGLRLEHTRSLGNSVTLNKIVDRNYANLFPSVFLTYSASANHQWRTSYSRRIDRPNYQDLNPFVYVMDPYTYYQGNPFLRPQYTNALQLGYTYKSETSISLSYNHTTDVITGVNDQQNQELRVTTVNLASLRNVNLSIGFPIKLTKWWSFRQSADVFLNAYDAEYSGQRLDYRQLSANLTMNHSLTLPRGFTAEVSGFYNSPLVYGMMKFGSMGQVSLGMQKSFWNKTATLRLNVSDVLGIQQGRGSTDFGQMRIRFVNRWESRVARLTFTRSFGNRNLKTARQRRTGVEEEQNRIGGGGSN